MDLKYYLYHFARLHTARYKGKPAPHKAVLLLAVMRLVENGIICSPEIELSDELIETFKSIWVEKLPKSCPFTCDISKPYYHMQHEPFWRLIEYDEACDMVAEELGLYSNQKKELSCGYTVKAMRQKFRCARIDNQLFEVIRDADNRKELENLLVAKYMSYDTPTDKRSLITAILGASLVLVA